MNKRPIFITGLHKSGTSLLRNLLDGHPDLFCIPFESHFFQLDGSWVDNEYRRNRPRPSLTAQEHKNRFSNWVKKMNSTRGKYSDAFVYNKLNIETFETAFDSFNTESSRTERFKTYMNAILSAVGYSETDEAPRIVEKSVEHAEFVPELHAMYPEAVFLRIIRNPYSNLVSLRKFQSTLGKYPLIHRALATMENSYRNMYRNADYIQNHLIIRYEDLVSDVEKTMKDISRFCDISFSEELLTPTIMGRPWKGNSTTGKSFRGVSDENLGKWKNKILPMEVYYINKLFPFLLDDFGYEPVREQGSFLKKHKDENIQRYAANRLYRIYLHHIDE